MFNSWCAFVASYSIKDWRLKTCWLRSTRKWYVAHWIVPIGQWPCSAFKVIVAILSENKCSLRFGLCYKSRRSNEGWHCWWPWVTFVGHSRHCEWFHCPYLKNTALSLTGCVQHYIKILLIEYDSIHNCSHMTSDRYNWLRTLVRSQL